MKLTARSIVLPILFFIFYILYFISPVSAQSPNPYLNPTTNPDVPKNLHTWTQTVMIEVMSAMSCQLTGIDPTDPKGKCLGVDPKTGNIGFAVGGGGAIGVAGHMIAMLYTPPLHTADYFRYLASNFGIAKPAHAAGFEGLKPVQSLWIAFRNVVYLLFVIIFIVIGLAIMLRVRIDPRTVMTIQNQIPKIIIGLLLLTFSFAIAGFLIDMMYVVIFLSYEVISGAVKTPGLLDDLNPLKLQGATPFTAAEGVYTSGIPGIALEASKSIAQIVADVFHDGLITFVKMLLPDLSILQDIVSAIFVVIAGPLVPILSGIAKLLGLGAGDPLSNIVLLLAGIIAFLVIGIALLISLIRLWFVLIITYISILLDVIFAPFWIAASLLPGSPIGFGAWIRSIISSLAVFPATIIMFLLAKVFIDEIDPKDPNQFIPPLIGGLSTTDTSDIGVLIALGIILMTPNVVSLVKAALRAPAVGVGPTIIGAVVGGMGAPGGILATAGHLGGALYGLSHIAGVIPGGERIPFLGRIRGQQRP